MLRGSVLTEKFSLKTAGIRLVTCGNLLNFNKVTLDKQLKMILEFSKSSALSGQSVVC